MRLSPDRYPEYVDFACTTCFRVYEDVKVYSIEGDSVRVECPQCDEPAYVRVID